MSEHAEHADHSKAFLVVFVLLLILTVVTVGLSFVPFPSHAMNIAIGVLVAVVKAALVVLIFMHLKWEKKWWLGIVLFPIALILIIIGLVGLLVLVAWIFSRVGDDSRSSGDSTLI